MKWNWIGVKFFDIITEICVMVLLIVSLQNRVIQFHSIFFSGCMLSLLSTPIKQRRVNAWNTTLLLLVNYDRNFYAAAMWPKTYSNMHNINLYVSDKVIYFYPTVLECYVLSHVSCIYVFVYINQTAQSISKLKVYYYICLSKVRVFK